jgi:probable rRNA maturation factor
VSEGASTAGVGGVVVVGHDETASVDLGPWVELARGALVHEGVTGTAELTLVFVDEVEMAALNEEHMDVAGPTDVLAFPLDADPPGAADGLPRLLGDVVVCPTVAARYAAEKGWSSDDELALLIVHGVLHVLGHDHAEPDETAVMQGREQVLLDALYRVTT